MSSSGDELVSRLCNGENDITANELLKAILRGYPAECVRRLIRSDVPEAVKAGAWILSELGPASAPFLLPEVADLLHHELRNARFFALDAVLVNATSKDGPVVGPALMLIGDDEPAVRWKAMRFLGRASDEVLAGGIPFVSDAEVRELITWLISIGQDAQARDEVKQGLEDGNPLRRRVAAAAASRLAVTDPSCIERAAHSADDEVRGFAREEVRSGRRRDEE